MKKNVDRMSANAVSTMPMASPTSVSMASSHVPIDLLRKYSSPKPTNRPNTRLRQKLSNARLRELAKKHKPPQSWFDNAEEGLY